jgi:hypothetical protein
MKDFTKEEIYEAIHTTYHGEDLDLCNWCFSLNPKQRTCKYLPGVKLARMTQPPEEDKRLWGRLMTPSECPFETPKEEMAEALKIAGKIYVKILLTVPEESGPSPTIVHLIAEPEKVREEFDWWLTKFDQVEVLAAKCKNVMTGKIIHRFEK